MQISRSVFLACAVAISASPVFLQAQDTEVQIKARQALEQKMKELEGAPAAVESSQPPIIEKAPEVKQPEMTQSAVTAQPPKAPAPAPAPTPAPMTQPAPAPVLAQPTEPVMPRAADSATIEKAREALHQKMQQLENEREPAAPEKPAVAVKPAPAPQPQATNPPAETVIKPSKEALRAEKERQAAEAKARKQAEAEARAKRDAEAKAEKARKDAEAKAAKAQASKQAPVKPAMAKAQTNAAPQFAPIEAPATNLSGSKEERLQQLLQQYRSDQITPQQYHEQRAKILAEP